MRGTQRTFSLAVKTHCEIPEELCIFPTTQKMSDKQPSTIYGLFTWFGESKIFPIQGPAVWHGTGPDELN